MSIQNIVLDMGQVLIHYQPAQFAAQTGVPAGDQKLLIREVFRSVEWVRLDRGTISEEDACRQICGRLPAHLHAPAKELITNWWKTLLPVDGMAALVEELKSLGYGIYLLSNANKQLPVYFPEIPGSEYFDGRIVSADWHFLKPQPELYHVLLREYGLDAAACFFIDDSPLNVEGAQNIGMEGTVFYGDIPRLRRELRHAGIPVRP